MEHHTKVSGGDSEDLTDLLRGKALDLTKRKGQTLILGCGLEAVADLLPRLFGEELIVGASGWLAPAPSFGKSAFEDIVDIVYAPILGKATPRLLELAIENPEDPGAHMGPPLEPCRCLDKSGEGILRRFFGLDLIQPGTAGRSNYLLDVGIDDSRQSLGISPADPHREIRIIE
jgi:hypothetical protein